MTKKPVRVYQQPLWFNGQRLKKVLIDPHFEKKHQNSINDDLILELVRTYVDNEELIPESVAEEFSYFVLHISHELKSYRLIFCTAEYSDSFIVINCFRERKTG